MSVDLIMSLGDDQMANQFVFLLPTGIPGGGDADSVSLRLEESFPMPDENVGEYPIVYQGMTILKTNMKDETDKHFVINVRLDSQWKIYNDLKAWKDLVYNPKNGTALSDMATRTTAVIQALDGTKSVVKTFTFKHVKLKRIKVTDFSHSEDNPSKLELEFIYGYME